MDLVWVNLRINCSRNFFSGILFQVDYYWLVVRCAALIGCSCKLSIVKVLWQTFIWFRGERTQRDYYLRTAAKICGVEINIELNAKVSVYNAITYVCSNINTHFMHIVWFQIIITEIWSSRHCVTSNGKSLFFMNLDVFRCILLQLLLLYAWCFKEDFNTSDLIP